MIQFLFPTKKTLKDSWCQTWTNIIYSRKQNMSFWKVLVLFLYYQTLHWQSDSIQAFKQHDSIIWNSHHCAKIHARLCRYLSVSLLMENRIKMKNKGRQESNRILKSLRIGWVSPSNVVEWSLWNSFLEYGGGTFK